MGPSVKQPNLPISTDEIGRRIFLIRGCRVMLDSDLAKLYNVTTFNLNKAVKRNLDRFPEDFMFRLSQEEFERLTFQTGISSLQTHGGRRHRPFAFTEQGVAMLSSVLRSKRAVQMNIAIMRVFVNLRQMVSARRELAGKLRELERRIESHDAQIRSIFDAIHELMDSTREPPKQPSKRIGFRVD